MPDLAAILQHNQAIRQQAQQQFAQQQMMDQAARQQHIQQRTQQPPEQAGMAMQTAFLDAGISPRVARAMPPEQAAQLLGQATQLQMAGDRLRGQQPPQQATPQQAMVPDPTAPQPPAGIGQPAIAPGGTMPDAQRAAAMGLDPRTMQPAAPPAQVTPRQATQLTLAQELGLPAGVQQAIQASPEGLDDATFRNLIAREDAKLDQELQRLQQIDNQIANLPSPVASGGEIADPAAEQRRELMRERGRIQDRIREIRQEPDEPESGFSSRVQRRVRDAMPDQTDQTGRPDPTQLSDEELLRRLRQR